MSDREPQPPEGWQPSRRSSPFLDLIGPLHATADELTLGLRARTHLLNGRGFLHAAVVTALADVALGRALTPHDGGEVGAVTASLTVDFLDRVAEGDWVTVTAEATRAGRRMGFAQARVSVDDRLVAQASGVFALAGPRS